MKIFFLLSFFILVGCDEQVGKAGSAAPVEQELKKEKLIIESHSMLTAETSSYVKIDQENGEIEVVDQDQEDLSDRIQSRNDDFNCKLISHIGNKFPFKFKAHYLSILSGRDQLLFKRVEGVHEELEGVWENKKVEDGYSVVTRLTIEGENYLHLSHTCVPL